MSRQIPIIVEPGYDAHFRSSRRGSESNVNTTQHSENLENSKAQFEDPARHFHNRKFMRRHSEDPNAHSWSTHNFHAMPSFVNQDQFSGRRGSVPVNWGRPQGRRDRFQEIVERMMTANDDELLSGIMENDFEEDGPFDIEEVTEEYVTPDGTSTQHKKINRSPSAPVVGQKNSGSESPKPTVLNYTKDKNGCIEIPVQICKNETDMKKNEKTEEKLEKTADKVEMDKTAEGTVESNVASEESSPNASSVQYAKKENMDNDKEENVEEHVVTISVDSTPESIEPNNNAEEKTVNSESKMSQEKDLNANEFKGKNEILNVDETKLNSMKKIEEDLEKTHEQVEAFKTTPTNQGHKEYLFLEDHLMKYLMALDAVEANGSIKVKEARKSLVIRVQEDLKNLEQKRVNTG